MGRLYGENKKLQLEYLKGNGAKKLMADQIGGRELAGAIQIRGEFLEGMRAASEPGGTRVGHAGIFFIRTNTWVVSWPPCFDMKSRHEPDQRPNETHPENFRIFCFPRAIR